eukprot:CFRG8492T1
MVARRSKRLVTPTGAHSRQMHAQKLVAIEMSKPFKGTQKPKKGSQRRTREQIVRQDSVVTTYAKESPSSSDGTNNSSDKENNDNSPLENSSVDVPDSAQSSDFEDVQPPTNTDIAIKRTRPTAKFTTKSTKGRTGKYKTSIVTIDLSASGREIFDMLKEGSVAAQEYVDAWGEKYKRNNEESIRLLLNSLLLACGCTVELSAEMFESENMEDILESLEDGFPDTSDYPIVSSEKQYKRFQSRLLEFYDKLIARMGNDVLYDDYMLAKLCQWLLLLSSHSIRAIRHTSTVVTFGIMDALITLRNDITKELDTTQRQLDTEKRAKRPTAGTVSKIASLDRKCADCQEKLVALNEYILELFTGVFVHRFRDASSEIRILAITSLGGWLVEGKDMFLHDKYLKYAGWQLNDREGDVRLACMRSLKKVYGLPELHSQLEGFTERFSGRMCQMIDDVNNNVACEAIDVVSLISSFNVVTDKTNASIYVKVNQMDVKIARAAGRFIYNQIFTGEGEDVPVGDEDCLIKFLKVCTEHEESINNVDSFVDAIWDYLPCLQDWALYHNLMYARNTPNSQESIDTSSGSSRRRSASRKKGTGAPPTKTVLPKELEITLLKVLTAAAYRAVGPNLTMNSVRSIPRESVLAMYNLNRKRSSSKQRGKMSEAALAITDRFLGTLADIWVEHGADTEKLECLVRLMGVFDHNTMRTSHASLVKTICGYVSDAFLKGSGYAFSASCMELLVWLSTDDCLKEIVDVNVAHMADTLQTRLSGILDAYHNCEDSGKTNEVDNLKAIIRRIRILYTQFDLSSYNDLNQKVALIVDDCSEEQIDSELAVMAIHTIFLCLLWQLRSIDPEDVDKDYTSGLSHRVNIYISQLINLMLTNRTPTIQLKSFLLVADTCFVFSRSLKSTSLHSVALFLDDHAMQQCRDFVLEVLEGEIATDEDLMHARLDDFKDDVGDMEKETESSDVTPRRVLNMKHILITFLKLVAHGLVKVQYGAPFLTLYSEKEYVDLFKNVFSLLRKGDYQDVPTLMLTYLTMAFEDEVEAMLAQPDGDWDEIVSRIKPLLDLSRRFSLTFPIESTSTTDAEKAKRNAERLGKRHLHAQGIKYCVEKSQLGVESTTDNDKEDSHNHLYFFYVLSEFVPKLNRADASQILEYTLRKTDELNLHTNTHMYGEAIQHYLHALRKRTGDVKSTAPRASRNRYTDEDIENSDDGDSSKESTISAGSTKPKQGGKRTAKHGRPTTQPRSTAKQKQQRSPIRLSQRQQTAKAKPKYADYEDSSESD